MIKFRKLAVKLALSDPLVMFEGAKGFWDNGALIDSKVTSAWLAAYQWFGAPWKNRDTFNLKPVTPTKKQVLIMRKIEWRLIVRMKA